MRITIVVEDGLIAIDGQGIANIPSQYMQWIPENVSALQWYDDYGEIEFFEGPDRKIPPNEVITELGIWQNAVTTYNEEIQRRQDAEQAELAAIEAATDYWKVLDDIIQSKLQDSDWTQGVDSPLSFNEQQSWKEYRQKLRDLNNVISDPKPLATDENHPSWPAYEFKEYPDHGLFWESLTSSTIYDKIKEQSLTSLPVTSLSAELISLFADAKLGNIKVNLIQNAFTSLLQNLVLTQDDYALLQSFLVSSKLDTLYTIS